MKHETIKSKIRTIPDFPKKGVMFRDITTLFKDAEGLRETVSEFLERYRNKKIDVVAGIESRGFIIGGIIAYELGLGFVPIRKKGKLPYKIEKQEYQLEYGTDCVEIHIDSIKKNDKVLLVDDLLATGGTMLAAAQLVKKLGGIVEECGFIIDLPELKGREKLEKNQYKTFCIVEFEGE